MSLRNAFVPSTGSNRRVHTDKVQLGRANGEGALIEPHPDNPTGALVNMKGVYAYEDELTAPSISVSQLRSRPNNDLVAELSNNELLGQTIRAQTIHADLVDVSSLVVQGQSELTLLEGGSFDNVVLNGGFTEWDGTDFDDWDFEQSIFNPPSLQQINSSFTESGKAAKLETASGILSKVSSLTQTIDVSENAVYTGRVRIVGGSQSLFSSPPTGTVRILDSLDNVLSEAPIRRLFDSPIFVVVTVVATTAELKLQVEVEPDKNVEFGDASLTRQQNDTLSLDLSNVDSIHIGTGASANRETRTIALGVEAGEQQLRDAIAIGYRAGRTGQRPNSIALGFSAGNFRQEDSAVAIGRFAGSSFQGQNSVAIGLEAGDGSLTANSIAIGNNAGKQNTEDNMVILNATGEQFPTTSDGTIQASSFYVRPIRGVAHGLGAGVMKYNDTTGEITYSTD